MVAVEELLISLTLFFGIGLIWALAMPRFIERLQEAVAKRLAIALFLFALPSLILVTWASFNV
jgi:hypothetical protein